MPTPAEADPVGLTEIAARLGVQEQSAHNWRTRGRLPEPRWTVGGRPAWDWHLDIHPWAATTGRLHRKDHPMATTTQITSIGHLLDLTPLAGDFADEHDMATANAAFAAAVDAAAPEGITVLANGDVIATLAAADEARDVDWKALTDSIDGEAILERHAIPRPLVVLGAPEQAQWLADMPQLWGNGHRLDVTASTVALTPEALEVLADLATHNDGHYDGTSIWIGGTGYRVEQ